MTSGIAPANAARGRKETATSGAMEATRGIIRSIFLASAFILALFPSVMKIYETSHWFREGDPSAYDVAKERFSNPGVPFRSFFVDPMVLMHVYFFIVPYILSALCVSVGLSVRAVPSALPGPQRSRRRCRLFGSFPRRSFALPLLLVKLGLPPRVSIAELFGIALFLALNILTTAARVRRSLPRGSGEVTFLIDSDEDASEPIRVLWDKSVEPIDRISWQAAEVWAKTLGVISILNLGWYLLIPIGRKSVLLEAMGMSWERAVKYHRWIGYYAVAIMIVHGIMYVSVWIHGAGHPSYNPGMLRRNMVPWYCLTNECSDDDAKKLRINMYGFATLFLILTMTGFTLPWIRRQKFEWFYYTHHLFVVVLVFVCLHYKDAIIYLLPGIAVYSVDKLMGLYAYHKAAPVTIRLMSSDVLEISFQSLGRIIYNAGDYVFLNVPAVSFLQWHPFSITSAPSAHGNKVQLHLKDIGSWTKQVIEVAKRDGILTVRLDGFYSVYDGICDQLTKKDGVILVGGGIGITPMMSLAMEMCNKSRTPVTLLWVVRSIDDFGVFASELTNAHCTYEHFEARVWITLSSHTDSEKKELLQVDKFRSSLLASKESQPRLSGVSPFVLDQPRLSGASNSAVMALSIFYALVAFALASKISNGDRNSLMELSMVSLFVFLWVLLVITVRRTAHTKMEMLWRIEDAFSEITDMETAQTINEGLYSIVEGGIGCRPLISKEFSSIATMLIQQAGGPVDIAVLACGPPKMIESIHEYIDDPRSMVSRDSRAFFSFIEEDWEW